MSVASFTCLRSRLAAHDIKIIIDLLNNASMLRPQRQKIALFRELGGKIRLFRRKPRLKLDPCTPTIVCGARMSLGSGSKARAKN